MTEWLNWTELRVKLYAIKQQSHSYGFSRSHVQMWELNNKKYWAQENWSPWMWCSRRLMRTSWTARRSNPSMLKETSPEYSSEGLILWPPDAKSWLIGKDPNAGKDFWRQKKRATEDEVVGWTTQWSWVCANSGRWWRTGKPGML